MYTQCPHCLTIYQPHAQVLARGRGQLQCGVCERQFDALERLSEQPIHAVATRVTAAATPVRVTPEQAPMQGYLFEPQAPLPKFIRQRSGVAATHRSAAWWLGSLALALVLSVQVVSAQRVELARDPRWRPWLEGVCVRLGCELPAWREPHALSLTARDVRQHPSVADALMISVTFRNDARWAQPWPLLQVALSDLDGKPLALRRFQVSEYLGAMARESLLAPGQSVSATLEVQDPGKQAVAFAFELL